MSYLNAIAKARHAILADMEEPDTLHVSLTLKHALLRELEAPYTSPGPVHDVHILGMRVEWTKPKPLTEPQITIRTKKGDTRIVSMLDGAKRE